MVEGRGGSEKGADFVGAGAGTGAGAACAMTLGAGAGRFGELLPLFVPLRRSAAVVTKVACAATLR